MMRVVSIMEEPVTRCLLVLMYLYALILGCCVNARSSDCVQLFCGRSLKSESLQLEKEGKSYDIDRGQYLRLTEKDAEKCPDGLYLHNLKQNGLEIKFCGPESICGEG